MRGAALLDYFHGGVPHGGEVSEAPPALMTTRVLSLNSSQSSAAVHGRNDTPPCKVTECLSPLAVRLWHLARGMCGLALSFRTLRCPPPPEQC